MRRTHSLARLARGFTELRPLGKVLAGLGGAILVAAIALYAAAVLSAVTSESEVRWKGGSLLIERPSDIRYREQCTITPDNGDPRTMAAQRVRVTLGGADSRITPWFTGDATIRCESDGQPGSSNRAHIYVGLMADIRALYSSGLFDAGVVLAGIVPLVAGTRMRKPAAPSPAIGPPGWNPPPPWR